MKTSGGPEGNGGGQSILAGMPGVAAAGIVHDINNELTLILNHLAVSGVKNPDLDAAQLATSRCAALTSDLLSLWRRVHPPQRQSRVEAAPLIRELIANLRLPKSIALMLDDSEGAPAMNVDPQALRRVMLNLILNACEAMNNKGVLAITITPHRIVVVDSGPGIAPDDLPRIFTPFFTTRGSRGTGLGLSVVHQLMLQQGGTVAVESEPGCTVFELNFKQ